MLLFIGAHLDDIEIGCGGYLSYLKRTIGLDCVDIKVIVLSEGFDGNRIDISKKRREAFEVNMEKLGVTDYYVIDQRIDTQFFDNKKLIKFQLNKTLNNPELNNINLQTALYGKDGLLDSLALITLIMDLEDKISNEFNKCSILSSDFD